MPNPTPNSKYPQAYNIAEVGTNDAEINLYGEVVATRPVDFWTGKPLPGDYIEQDVFLRDLDELSTKDNITVHINSVGGDFYAGLAIYNRLRSLNASITTINDSLAASAGSIIFMAGEKGKRKVNAGSNLMIHGVLSFLFGYPDLLSQAETAARSEGVAAERARIQGIEEIEATIGDAVLVNSAKFGDKPMNAEQLAFAALKAQAAIGATVLNKLENDTKASGADDVAATPAETAEPTDDEKSVNLLLGRIPNMKEGK